MSTGAIKLQNDQNNHKTIIKVVHILYSNSSKVEECEEQTENRFFF